MGSNTKIEWAHHTLNPWIGCTQLTPACDHCYAMTQNAYRKWVPAWNADRRRTSAATWNKAFAWDRAAALAGERHRVFCASLADVFDNQVPNEWRGDLWALISGTPHLDWLLLTKRPQNIAKMLPLSWGDGWPNVWLGATTEDQQRANQNVPALLGVPARVRFLSCEPLLGPIDLANVRPTDRYELNALTDYDFDQGTVGDSIDWVIVGGESGPAARPPMIGWVRELRDQCTDAHVSFFFKQWGEFTPDDPAANQTSMRRVGKAHAGRALDGREHNDFPVSTRNTQKGEPAHAV